jgi:putative phosphoesterase
VRAAIIADTHMPRGARRLTDGCIDQLRHADLIIHAGDLTGEAVLEQLSGYGKLIAIHGNADERAVRDRLPAQLDFELDGVRVAVVHDSGPRQGRLQRLRRAFPEADAVIFAHSHLPLHETDANSFQIFNPGSPTERRRAPHRTMGVADITRGRIAFRLLPLD